MKFNLTDEIPFPRDIVVPTIRDRLQDLLPYLPNVEAVDEQVRNVEGEVIELVNVWTGSADDVPRALQTIIRPDILVWKDVATWDQSRWRCDWEIELSVLKEAVTAKGYNLYQDEGDETIIQMNGEITIHADRIPGVPGFIGRRAGPAVEKFVIGIIQPNLKLTNKAVGQLLEDEGA